MHPEKTVMRARAPERRSPMKKLVVLMVAAGSLIASLVWAGGDLSRQAPMQLKVLVGA